jgi:hypothetical protein
VKRVLRSQREQFDEIGGALPERIGINALAVERRLESSEQRNVERDASEYSE